MTHPSSPHIAAGFWGLLDHVDKILGVYGLPTKRPLENEEVPNE